MNIKQRKRMVSLVIINVLFTLFVIMLTFVIVKLHGSIYILNNENNISITNTSNSTNFINELEDEQETIEEPEQNTSVSTFVLTEKYCNALIAQLEDDLDDVEQDYNRIEYKYYAQQREMDEAEQYVLDLEEQIAKETNQNDLDSLYDEYSKAKNDFDREEDRFRQVKYDLKISERAVTSAMDDLREAKDMCRDI